MLVEAVSQQQGATIWVVGQGSGALRRRPVQQDCQAVWIEEEPDRPKIIMR